MLLAVCMLTGMPYVAENVFATSATEKKEDLMEIIKAYERADEATRQVIKRILS